MNVACLVKPWCKPLLLGFLGVFSAGLIGCGGGNSGTASLAGGFGTIAGSIDRSSTDSNEVIVQLEGTELQTTPDAAGNFTFGNVPAGEYTVAVLKAGLHLGVALSAQVVPGKVTYLGSLQLRPAGQIAGLVTTSDPQTGVLKPVGHARVVARPVGEVTDPTLDHGSPEETGEEEEGELPELPSPFRIVLTQPDGSYQIRGVAPGHYVVAVTHPQFQSAQQEVDVEVGQTTAADFSLQPLELQEWGNVEGTVTDSDRNPLGHVRVELFPFAFKGRPDSPALQLPDFNRLDPAFVPLRRGELVAYTDEQGHYALRGIRPAFYRIIAAKRGYDLGEQEVEVKAGETLTVDFVLTSRLVEVTGTVFGVQKDGSKVPLEKARVFVAECPPLVRPAAGRMEAASEDSSWPGGRVAALTDAEGKFRVQVTPGPTLLLVHKEGFHPARQFVIVDPTTPTEVHFELQPQPPAVRPQPVSLQLELTLPAAEFPAGTPVGMTLQITNPTSETVRVSTAYPGGYDFAVHSHGEEIWRWSHDKVFAAVIGELVLAPGEAREFRQTWDQKNNEGQSVPPGEYAAIGFLATYPPLRTEPVKFQILNSLS